MYLLVAVGYHTTTQTKTDSDIMPHHKMTICDVIIILTKTLKLPSGISVQVVQG